MVVLGKEVVIGLGELQLDLELYRIYEIDAIEEGALGLFGNALLPGLCERILLGSIFGTNFSNVLKDVIMIFLLTVSPRFLLRYLSDYSFLSLCVTFLPALPNCN